MFVKPRPQPGRRTSTRVWLLLAVLALGLGLRVANLADVSNSPFFTRPVIDGQAYDNWAMAIVKGKAPAQPFYQDPLYPYFLALVYSVFGHGYWAVYLFQLALALVFLLLVYDTTRRLFDRRAGIMATAMAALYKPFIFYESQVEKTSLAVFLTALFLWLFVRSLRSDHSSFGLRTSSFLWPLATGIALGLVALTRSNTLLFAPLLPLAYLLNRSRSPASRSSFIVHRSSFVSALLSVLGVLVVIAPVSIRNSILAREFTLTTTQAGQNLYIGNSPYNTTGQYQAPPWVRPTPEFEQSDFAEYANKAAGKTLSYSEVSRFYTRAALNWATSHGRDFAKLLWRKTVLYFNNLEVPDNQDLYFFARYSWVLRLPLLSFGLVFALGLAAMILLARGLGRLSMVVFYFGYAASVITFFVFSRYRIPALPALLPFAGAMLPWLADTYNARPSPHAPRPQFPARLAGGLALILAAFSLTLYPVHHGSGKTEAAQSLVNLGSLYFHEGDTARAVATYKEALATQPGHAEASRNLGIIMLGRNDVDRAFQLLSDAARGDPSNPTTHLFLGKIYERRAQLETAYLEFGEAVALAPGRVEFRFELATALQQLDKYREALAQYDTMIQLAPDNPMIRHNYAVCLYNIGRLDDARIQLEEARRLGGPINPRFDSLLNAGRRLNR
jgi:Flp pilus assembly protein TadD